ncbi:MAG: FKBP-type peptidyl-prolyl cis-trans isomerase [Bacteroidales bacterium]|nr:FKBP-type peptidyl-prolyl cis-trans isomerase [Bacteroidales bacterium]
MSKKPNRVVQYKLANEKFLEQKAQEEGIKVLDSGILLRQTEKGSGTRSPQLRSTVYVHYTGRLIDGTVFDSTEGQLPACFRVDELIVGWQAALLRMHEGDTLQIYIPARYGYGSSKLDGIPAWSTLDFTLTLVKVL